jgi:3-oxoacyl-[acyl-carrier-protein] synthase II
MAAGQSGIGPITLFDASDYKAQIAGEVKDFDPVALFGRKESRRMSRLTQFALAAANQAIDDANLNGTNRERVGVMIGSGMGSLDPIVDNVNTLNERGHSRVSPFFVPMMLVDTPLRLSPSNTTLPVPICLWPPPAPPATTPLAKPAKSSSVRRCRRDDSRWYRSLHFAPGHGRF